MPKRKNRNYEPSSYKEHNEEIDQYFQSNNIPSAYSLDPDQFNDLYDLCQIPRVEGETLYRKRMANFFRHLAKIFPATKDVPSGKKNFERDIVNDSYDARFNQYSSEASSEDKYGGTNGTGDHSDGDDSIHAPSSAPSIVLSEELEVQDQELALERKRLEDLDAQLERDFEANKAKLVGREAKLKDRENKLAEREIQIANKETELMNNESKLMDHKAKQANRQTVYNDLQTELQHQKEKTANYQALLKKSEDALESMQKRLQKAEEKLSSKDDDIKDTTKQLNQNNHAIQDMINQLAEKDEQAKDVARLLSEKDDTIKDMGLQLAKNDGTIKHITHQVTRRDEKIQDITSQLNKKDEEIRDIVNQLKKKNDKVQSMTDVWSKNDEEFKSMTEELSKSHAKATDLTNQLTESNDTVKDLTTKLNEKTKELSKSNKTKDKTITDLQLRINVLCSDIHGYQSELRNLQASSENSPPLPLTFLPPTAVAFLGCFHRLGNGAKAECPGVRKTMRKFALKEIDINGIQADLEKCIVAVKKGDFIPVLKKLRDVVGALRHALDSAASQTAIVCEEGEEAAHLCKK